ncbi:uncharacterized protein TNCV_2781981 [Trichonephila clavipes]|nr:uncharacterized protein TNCV_2781981 [Trichonephila clavipes]
MGVKDRTRNGRCDPKCLAASRLPTVREDTGAPVKVLPVPGWRPMKLLALRVHFVRCGGLFNNWFFDCVLSLVFVYMTSLGSTGPYTSSQHNQSGLIDELLT